MACRLGFVLLILTALLGASPARAQAGGQVTGVWLTQAGDARVRVSKCGGGICGVIVWLRVPIDPATGKIRLFGAAELRLGADNASVVRIERTDGLAAGADHGHK